MSAAEEAYRAAEAAIDEVARADADMLQIRGGAYQALKIIPSSISNLSHLRELRLNNTQVSDLTPIGGLAALKTLDLSKSLVSDLRPLQGLTGLNVLDIRATRVFDLTPLRDVTGLIELDVSDDPVVDLTGLEDLGNLQSLTLECSQVVDLAPLRNIVSLRVLTLDQLQVSDLTPLEGLINLQTLSLDRTAISDLAPLRNLNQLRHLIFSETRVSDLSPLRGLKNLEQLVVATPITDVTPLQALTKLQSLSLGFTQVADLRPIRKLSSLASGASDRGSPGLYIWGCTAARNDPEGLGRLAEIKDDMERTGAILEYLNGLPDDWTPPGDPVERAMSGPILDVSLADLEIIDARFSAVSPDPPLPRERGRGFDDLVTTLDRAAGQIAASRQIAELGPSVVGDFETYRMDLLVEQPNGRLLNYAADSIRGVLSDDYLAGALDGQTRARIVSFLQLHDDLMRRWFPGVQRIIVLEPDLSPDEIINILPEKLGAAETQIQFGINLGVFSANVQEPLPLLQDRFHSARHALANMRDGAVNELRRVVTLTTAWLGRIKGRLLQYVLSHSEFQRAEPARTSAEAAMAIASVQRVLAALGPIFDDLWKWMNALPLPF